MSQQPDAGRRPKHSFRAKGFGSEGCWSCAFEGSVFRDEGAKSRICRGLRVLGSILRGSRGISD